MKKIFIFLVSAVLLMAGCQKEETIPSDSMDGKESVTFTVGIPTDQTKADADGDGNAALIDHWVMEVRDAENALFIRQEKDALAGTETQTFSFNLFKNHTYNIQFWADTKGAYNTADLTAVSTVGTVANLDSRDAFSANVVYTSEKAENKSVTLTRPFAQINIVTTDLAKMKGQVVPATYSKYVPTDITATAVVPTTFNVQTQSAGTPSQTAVTASTCYADFESGAQKTTVFMDYVFASVTDKDLVDIGFSFKSNGNQIAYDFTSIPLQRNYRTNIYGDLLSNATNWTVTVDPVWLTPEFTVDFYETTVDNIAAVNSALGSEEAYKAKEVSVIAKMPTDSDSEEVTFTSKNNGQVVDIKLEGTAGSANTITFKNDGAATTEGPTVLNVVAPENTKLVFDNEFTHVVINGTKYENISGSFSATSLIISEGVTVNNLDITEGGLEIHGTVNNVTVSGSSSTVFVRACENLSVGVYNVLKDYLAAGYVGQQNGELWDVVLSSDWTNFAAKSFSQIDEGARTITIVSAEEFALLARKSNEKPDAFSGYTISLGCDVDLKGHNWIPVVSQNITFDGKNHKILNLSIDNKVEGNSSDVESYTALFGDLGNSAIKNLVVDKPTVKGVGVDYTAVIAAHFYGTMDNCSVIGGTVDGKEQVGALVGYLWCGSVANCTVYGTEVSGVNRVGGVAGKANVDSQFQILGNTVENAVVTASERHDLSGAAGVVAQIMTGDGTWEVIGNIVKNVTTTTGSDNTLVPVGEFRKGCFAADAVSAGHIVGNEWYPEGVGYYEMKDPADASKSVRIINAAFEPAFKTGDASYFTLAEAVAAVEAGGTIEIVKTGEYVIPDIPENITIKGKKGVVMNCVGSASICSIPNGVTFEDIEFNFGNNNYHGFHHAGAITFTDCILNDCLTAYGTLSFSGCMFKQPANDVYSIWTYGSDVTFENCDFSGTNKAVLVYTETLAKDQVVNVSGCTFKASATDDLKAAVQINSVANAGNFKYIVNISSSTCSGFNDIYGFKHSPAVVDATVTVDGKVVYADKHNLNLQTASDLVAFSASVNGGYTYSGKTVYLADDIDLIGIDWIPAGNVNDYPSKAFDGTFDGQNHVIANLTCTDTTPVNACAGLFGGATGTVKNIKLTDVNISSTHYAGAVLAYSSASSVVIENCYVFGGTVTSTPEKVKNEWDNGDKVGAIAGYMVSGDKVLNCSVESVTVKAFRDLGGILGMANGAVQFKNNSIRNSNVIQDNTNGYKKGVTTYNELIGREDTPGAVKEGNTYTNVFVNSIN